MNAKLHLIKFLIILFLIITANPTFSKKIDINEKNKNDLEKLLAKKKLTAEDMKTLDYPFSINRKIKVWCRETIKNCPSDMEKAISIFKGILSEDNLNIIYNKNPEQRVSANKTSTDVFKEIDDQGYKFAKCDEYAYIYITLMRHIGIKSNFVVVFVDNAGKKVLHGCASIYIGGKCILVDLAYKAFNITHKSYIELNDIQSLATHHYDEAGILLANKKYDEAELNLNLALKIDDSFGYIAGKALSLLGLINYCKYKNLEQAEVFYKKAIKRSPDDIMVFSNWALILNMEKRYSEAYLLLKNCVKLDPSNSQLYFLMGSNKQKLKDIKEAKKLYLKAVELKPNTPEAYYNLGKILEKQKDIKEAERYYRLALVYKPDFKKAIKRLNKLKANK